jgi:hypothetical protein
MTTTFSNNSHNSRSQGPGWASALGAVAITFGVLLAAAHGNEWMKQIVIIQSTPGGNRVPAAECPEDELVEEGLSLAECEQLVNNVRNLIVSAPPWFPRFQATLAAVGAVVAIFSIMIGAALISDRSWAPAAAILTFGALAAIDVIGFIGVLSTGPILRDLYLWNVLLWFYIHLMMTVAATGGRDSQRQA